MFAWKLGMLALASGIGLAAPILPAHAGKFKVLATFQGGSDGEYPTPGLTNIGGTLYGSTAFGGGQNCGQGQSCGEGTVFSVNRATGTEAIAYDFTGTATYLPASGLLRAGGLLWGETQAGSTDFYGALYSLDPATGAETNAYAFHGSPGDGAWPVAGLINVGGTFFGVTNIGGSSTNCGNSPPGCGTVFSWDRKTGIERVLYSFQGNADGAYPYAGLTVSRNPYGAPVAYGTTEFGGLSSVWCPAGPSGCGTIFSVNLATGAKTSLHTFGGFGLGDGAYPSGGLIAFDGMMFGTTIWGGTSSNCFGGCGTIYSLNPATGAVQIVHSFQRTDGWSPSGNLLSFGGKLWGATLQGGKVDAHACSAGCGTIFSFDPATGTTTVEHVFAGYRGGSIPNGSLISVGGTLYGATDAGGPNSANSWGTVFSYRP